ncbi:TolC family protein [Caproiciproducens faecalis]|uniref:Outer membrane efflux protein n=1 Tax=Caproiciproducens faecalis TaxID=2820301 RepID=A0ABS7DLY1_9FIRM|nr:TolC family protein [Caproiciproducens faecalis]MBW7572320.1 hypothetical protein [Caproiciproducens faecalis]
MIKRFLACFLAAVIFASASVQSAFAASDDAWDFKKVRYSDIESLVEDCVNFSSTPVDALQGSYGALNSYASILTGQLNSETPGTDAYTALAAQLAAVKANMAGISVTIGMLEQSMNGKDSPKESTVIAADTLFITYNSLRNQQNELSRKLGVFNQNLLNLQQLHDAGYLSDLQLAKTQEQGSSLQSGISAMQVQIDGVKRSFNTLLGRDYNEKLDIQPLPISELNDMKDMDFSDDLDDALSNYSGDLTGSGYYNDEYNEEKGSFAASFRKLYDTVNNKNAVLATEQKNLETEQKIFNASQLQYDMGLLSKLDLNSAQDTLDTQKAKVQSAQTDLFTAYEQYLWGKNYGIINANG